VQTSTGLVDLEGRIEVMLWAQLRHSLVDADRRPV